MPVRGLVLVLALVSAAGCFERAVEAPPPSLVRDPATVWPALSPRLEGVRLLAEHASIPAPDGKALDTWVFRPETQERVPVIVNFSPYWSNLAPPSKDRGDAFSRHLIDEFVPRGYAVALTSVRGTGLSEGCFDLGGDVEKRDAVAVIDWLAGRPWSNGNVAAGGKSYDGTTPQGAATLAPPALKAIIPVSAISELYKYNYMGGLPFGLVQGNAFNTWYPAVVGWGVWPFAALDVPPRPQGIYPWPEQTHPDDACAAYLAQNQEGIASATTGDYTPYWVERDYAKDARNATAALLFVHGLQDWNVKPDHVLPWLTNYGGPKKAWLHQWEQPENVGDEGGHVYPFRDDWNYTLLRFLDHTLKGIDTGFFEEPSVQVQDTTGRWRHESAWPPAETAPVRLLFSREGLSTVSGTGANVMFVDDGHGPDLDAADRTPARQIVLRSPPLEEEWLLAGTPGVTVRVATRDPWAKVAVTLYDVAPDGKAKVIDWGGLLVRLREDPRQPRDVSPTDGDYTLRIPMFPQDTVVPKGHRLALAIAGNAGDDEFFPRPGDGTPMTVYLDSSGWLELPRRTGELVLEEPQPTEAESCWAC